jgi:hypothetical protein
MCGKHISQCKNREHKLIFVITGTLKNAYRIKNGHQPTKAHKYKRNVRPRALLQVATFRLHLIRNGLLARLQPAGSYATSGGRATGAQH